MKRPWSVSLIVILTVVICVPLRVRAGAIGDPAAPLNITKWIKGEPVDLAAGKGKNVYLVEFWATWCGPCVASIPHLTQLQRKYESQGLVVIGVTCPDDRGNTLENVQEFVRTQGDAIGYRIAFDGDRRTHAGYMQAFQKNGIPQAFLVDRQGKIIWEGHPMMVDNILEEHFALTSRYDPATYKRVIQIRDLKNRYFALAVSPSNKGTVRALGRQILQQSNDIPELLTEFAWEIVGKVDLKVRELDQAVEAGRKAVEATKEQDPGALAAYAAALKASGQANEAAAHYKKALDLAKDPTIRAELETKMAGQVSPSGK